MQQIQEWVGVAGPCLQSLQHLLLQVTPDR